MEPNGQENSGGGSTEGWAGPQTTSLDDIEQMVGEAQEPNLLDQELKGDNVPEEFRGKKLVDVLGVIGGLKSALKISEEARTQALATTQLLAEQRTATPAPVQQVAQAPAEPAERTAEQWKELHDTDPFRYQEERFAALERRLSRGVEARVAPMASASVANAEQSARAKFPEEFQVLGKEIKAFVEMAFPTPEARSTLGEPEAWERVVKYIKGENEDKWFAHRQSKLTAAAATTRQAAESEAAPPTLSTSRSNGGSAPRGGKLTPATMDDTMKEIARNLMPGLPPQKAYEEYCKHYV